jgi:DNA-binding beta-propeller fold protein YncE
VKITDFGLARAAEALPLTQSGVVAGTPEYMSPEQARGEPLDPRSDLFSLGSVLHALCTGGPPFGGGTAGGVLRRVSDEEPPPLRERNPEVPVWLERLVARLLARNPADRFQTAAEVASLLDAYRAHLRQPATVPAPVLAPAPPRRVPADRSSGSRRRYGLLALALALPAVLLLAAALPREQAAPEQSRPAPPLAPPKQEPAPPGAAAPERARELQRLRAEMDALIQRQREAVQTQPPDAPRPAGGKAWTTAAGLLFLVLASSFVGAWWWTRRRRGAGKVEAATAAPFLAMTCPGCERRLRAHPGLAGKKVKCPGCGQAVPVPPSAEPPASGPGRPESRSRRLAALALLAVLLLGVGMLALGLLGAGPGTAEPQPAAELPPGHPPVPERGLACGSCHAGAAADPPLVNVRLAPAVDEQILALAFTPDGRKLVTAGAREKQPGQFMVWDVATGKEIVRERGTAGIRGVALAPDGQTMACGHFGGAVTFRDVATGRVRAEATGHTIGVNGLAFSRDGTRLVTAGLDRVLKLWDGKELQERQTFAGHTDGVLSVAFFGHGREFVSGGQDGTARIWDVAGGKERLTLRGHTAAVETVAVAPDDQLVATASRDRTVKLWDPATGAERATLGGHNGGVLGLAFSPDGRLLASATDRGTVSLWDVPTGQRVRTCQEHGAPVWSVAFSPDGKLLASGSSDRTARLWDLAAAREVAILSAAGPVQQVLVAGAPYVPPAGPAPRPEWRVTRGAGGERPMSIIGDAVNHSPFRWLEGSVLEIPALTSQRHEGGEVAVCVFKRARLVCQSLHLLALRFREMGEGRPRARPAGRAVNGPARRAVNGWG